MNKEFAQKKLEGYKKSIKLIPTKNKWMINYNFEYHCCFQDHLLAKRCDRVVIKTRRTILTPTGILYMQHGKKIFRFSKDKTIEILINVMSKYRDISRLEEKDEIEKIFYFVFNSLKNYNVIYSMILQREDFLECANFAVLKVLSQYKIDDTKLNRKILNSAQHFYNYSEMIYAISVLKKFKVTDPNVIRNAINYFSNYDYSKDFSLYAFVNSKNFFNDFRKFYRGTNNNADKLFFDRAIKASYYKDTLELYNSHKEKEEKFENIQKFNTKWFKLNFNDLHEKLSELAISDNAVMVNLTYKYSENVLNLEGKTDNYTFLLPKTSQQVSRLAELCSNCVAGYIDHINDTCLIMYGYKDQKVKDFIEGKNKLSDAEISELRNSEPLCIELTPYKKVPSKIKFEPSDVRRYGYLGCADNVVCQCYTFYNKYPSPNTSKIVNQFFDDIHYHHIDYFEKANDKNCDVFLSNQN